MRKLSGILSVLALVAGLSGNAAAETLNFDGTLTFTLGTASPVTTTAQGVATVTFSSGSAISALRLSNVFSAVSTAPLTDPNNATLVTLVGTNVGISAGATVKTLTNGALATTANQIPINGFFQLCLGTIGCSAPLDIPFQDGPSTGMGVGGVITVNGFAGSGVKISIVAHPWTIGQGLITGVPTTNGMYFGIPRATFTSAVTGFAHGPASATEQGATPTTGANNTDCGATCATENVATGGGHILLVTPTRVITNLNPPADFIKLPGELHIQFIPEPGFLLLLSAGAVGLAVLGRSRRR